jgi:predicted pyridoxine 5'-phosphate oxidase superfamily flavin-nucleotide-binding protein
MSKLYTESHRALQRRFDTERLADRIEEKLVRAHLTEEDKAFLESADMFFLATADAQGRPNCSYKGGDPGFVRVLDTTTLVFPCFDGNGMYLFAGNLSENPHVGLLFIDFERPRRLRVNGSARLLEASDVVPPYLETQFVVAVSVREVFSNCSRYIHKKQALERSAFVPRDGVETPSPEWKRSDWAKDSLPKNDPAKK